MLNEKWALAKLRAELEGKERRLCRHCGEFGHLAQKYRNREKQEKKTVEKNRFEVLKNWVMQCGVREVKRQEVVRNKVKCFRCRETGHKKWECLQKKTKEKKGSSTTVRSMGEGEETQ